MSGQMSQALAAAAGGIALRAEAEAKGVTIGRLIAAKTRASLEAHKGAEPDSLPGRVWRGMPQQARWLCCTMASKCDDADRASRMPWESFSDAERASMAAFARQMQGAFSAARCLF